MVLGCKRGPAESVELVEAVCCELAVSNDRSDRLQPLREDKWL